MIENWLPVTGHEDRFEISDLGRFRVKPTFTIGTRFGRPMKHRRGERILAPGKGGGRDYLRVTPRVNGVVYSFYIHRLVAEHFIKGQFDGATVNHLDGDKSNNRATNLEWISRADNTRHQWATGLGRSRKWKVSPNDVAAIRASTGPLADVANQYGVSPSLISKIRLGKSRVSGSCAASIWPIPSASPASTSLPQGRARRRHRQG